MRRRRRWEEEEDEEERGGEERRMTSSPEHLPNPTPTHFQTPGNNNSALLLVNFQVQPVPRGSKANLTALRGCEARAGRLTSRSPPQLAWEAADF